MEDKDAECTVNKLAMAANFYSTKSPAAARFYMYTMNAVCDTDERRQRAGWRSSSSVRGGGGSTTDSGTEQLSCPFCHSLLRPGDYTLTVKPKPGMTKKIQRLRRRQAEGAVLGRIHAKMLERYENATNQMILRCNHCGIADKVRGGGRNEAMLTELRTRHTQQRPLNAKRCTSSSDKSFITPSSSMSSLSKGVASKKNKKQKHRSTSRSKLSSESLTQQSVQYDSGLPESLTSTSRSESLSTISSVGLNSSLTSDTQCTYGEVWSTAPPTTPYTSTPKSSQQSLTDHRQKPSPKESLASFLSSIRGSPDSQSSKRSKKSRKRKGSLGKLESMLAQQKHAEASTRTKDTLYNFLTSV